MQKRLTGRQWDSREWAEHNLQLHPTKSFLLRFGSLVTVADAFHKRVCADFRAPYIAKCIDTTYQKTVYQSRSPPKSAKMVSTQELRRCMQWFICLYATYARNGTINVLLPFTDLLRNARPYVPPLSRLIFSYEAETWVHLYIFYLLKLITYLSYNLRYYLQYTSSLTKLRLTILGQLRLELKILRHSSSCKIFQQVQPHYQLQPWLYKSFHA